MAGKSEVQEGVDAERGVAFALVGDRRSTSAAGRAIVVDALAAADPVGSGAAARETNWRTGYVTHFTRLVEAGIAAPGADVAIATAGLASAAEHLRFLDDAGEDRPVAAALDVAGEPLTTETVTGQSDPDTALSIPYRGRRLAGDDLRARVNAWTDDGVMEPSARDAIIAVIDNPRWLALEGRTVVVFGGASEMGPLRALLRWGVTVAAVDLPRPRLWEELVGVAQASGGRLLLPAAPGSAPLPERAGVDLMTEPGRVAPWLAGLDGALVLGNYVYADGATNVRVSAAVDLVAESVRAARPESALAFLGTPTDVFAVPREVVDASVAAYAARKTSRVLRVPLRAASGGRLLRRAYVPGQYPGVTDAVVLQQGPNYLLAKRLQRWRATQARSQGATVSFRVAPPTRTRSVVKNRALAAAYAGASRFHVEVFEPGTANTLMAALLVHDLMNPSPPAEYAWQDEAREAVHGGLWRNAYDPRSALGLAALLGAASSRA